MFYGVIKGKNGQNTLEYIVLLTAVISFVIVFVMTGGPMNQALNEVWVDQSDRMVNATNIMFDKIGL